MYRITTRLQLYVKPNLKMRKRRKARIGSGGGGGAMQSVGPQLSAQECELLMCMLSYCIAFKRTQNELTVTRLGAPNEKVYRAFIA